jgi:gluconolactonase
VFGPDGLSPGGCVDGFSFDAEGNLWVTTVVRNGLGVLTRDGDWHVVMEDPREDALAAFGDKLAAGMATREPAGLRRPEAAVPDRHLLRRPDLRTVHVGSLAMSRLLPTFRAPVAGLPMRHWR